MKISKEEAKEKLLQIQAKMTGVTDDIFDDGVDSGDAQQNRAFGRECKKLDKLIEEAAHIEVEGIDADTLWETSWKGNSPFLPEGRYNNAIHYIFAFIEEIDKRQ